MVSLDALTQAFFTTLPSIDAQWQDARGPNTVDFGFIATGAGTRHIIMESYWQTEYLGWTVVLGVNKNTYKSRFAIDIYYKPTTDYFGQGGTLGGYGFASIGIKLLTPFSQDVAASRYFQDRYRAAADGFFAAGLPAPAAYTAIEFYLDEADVPDVAHDDGLLHQRLWFAVKYHQT